MAYRLTNFLFGNCTLLIKFQYLYTINKHIKKNRLQNNEIIEHFWRIMLQNSTLFKSVPMFEISGKIRSSYMG